MRNIRLIVAYDGTELCGYQRQANDVTVQGCLEEALSKVCNEPISIYGASRTDAGVHAKFQVITFFTEGRIPVENLTRALIAHLPPYIVVRRAEEIPLDWRPRWRILGKEYVYTIHNDSVQNPLGMRYHWHVKKPLDVERMREAARLLEGTHDFTSLQGANSTPANPVKTLFRVAIKQNGPHITLHVVGDGFLYHMVRNIAGLLVDVGLGKVESGRIPELLAAKDRRKLGKTAPAQGLCLEEIFFDSARLDVVLSEL
ncbi:tRNA pseudouridine(38-40) synthase TruA [Veillonella magna]|uniref:tRNA pseudouridine(38-40) synthase TruA n=1 Tax=Veillonella magna TaxID=464322 RepID=UPI0026671B59|nr:tRNA pseudouridine(38-40) synthase TruA [Veillonella magna]